MRQDEASNPFFGFSQNINQPLLSALWFRLEHVFPARRQRQTHEDALHAGARRVEAKGSAAVVDQVKLDVLAPADLLPFLVLFRKRHVLALLDDGNIAGYKGFEAVLG